MTVPKKLKRGLYLCIPLVVVVVAGLVLLSKWSSGPAEGTLHMGEPETASEQATTAEPLAVDTSLFTTTLPAGFVKKDASAPTVQLPIRWLATSLAGRQQVAFTGGALPTEGLSGIGDYNLRAKDTAAYKLSPGTTLPAGSVAYEDTGGSMVTLFWPHGDNFVEITVSGDPATSNKQYELLSKIQQSWQWK